jgi:hypothetical protein
MKESSPYVTTSDCFDPKNHPDKSCKDAMSRPDCQEWAEDLMCIGSSSRVSGTEQCLQLHSSPKVQKLICNCIASHKCKVAKVAAMLQFSIIIIFMLLNQARTEKCLLID